MQAVDTECGGDMFESDMENIQCCILFIGIASQVTPQNVWFSLDCARNVATRPRVAKCDYRSE